MRSVKRKHARRILLVAILASGFPVAAQGSSEFLGPTPVDSGMLAEVRALYGLDDRGAIERLAAENDAANVYRRIKGARLDGYAGAWFDAVSGKLQVALSVPEWADLISRLGATPVLVDWSLQELKDLKHHIVREIGLSDDGIRHVHVHYPINRVIVGVAPGGLDVVRTLLEEHSNKIDVRESSETLDLTADVRGGDGTRNTTWEPLYPHIRPIWPCSIGFSTANGYYTAGHCVEVGNNFTTPTGTPLGVGAASTYPFPVPPASAKDIAWVSTLPGWTPTPKVNGYSDGVFNVPAQWAGTNESPLYSTVCRYGQESGGPYCGAINAKGLLFGVIGGNFWFNTVTQVTGTCSNDGDSGGPWVSFAGKQAQGTNIGASTGNTCPTATDYAYFQPISHHITAYAGSAGSLLTTHGASAPTVTIPFGACPDMSMSGMGTFVCSVNPYHSQGVTDVTWGGGSVVITSDDSAFGTCSAHQTVSVTFNATNPYGSFNQSWSFPCPMGPIP